MMGNIPLQFSTGSSPELCLHIKHGSYKIDQTWKARYANELIPASSSKGPKLVRFSAAGTTSGDNGVGKEKEKEVILIDNMRHAI